MVFRSGSAHVQANQLARLESAGDIQRKMRKDHTQCAPRLTRVMSLDGVWAPVVPLLVTYNQSRPQGSEGNPGPSEDCCVQIRKDINPLGDPTDVLCVVWMAGCRRCQITSAR